MLSNLAFEQLVHLPESCHVCFMHAMLPASWDQMKEVHPMFGAWLIRRIESTPDSDTFEKYNDIRPISIAMLLQKHALLLAESSVYSTSLYYDMPPSHLYRDTSAEVLVLGVVGTPPNGVSTLARCLCGEHNGCILSTFTFLQHHDMFASLAQCGVCLSLMLQHC